MAPRKRTRRKRVTFLIALMQLWLASPLFTQRVLTALCIFFLVVMLLGILRERDVMARLHSAMPVSGQYTAPASLLRVNAAVAVLNHSESRLIGVDLHR